MFDQEILMHSNSRNIDKRMTLIVPQLVRYSTMARISAYLMAQEGVTSILGRVTFPMNKVGAENLASKSQCLTLPGKLTAVEGVGMILGSIFFCGRHG